MNITGVSRSGNPYPFAAKKPEDTKGETAQARPSQADSVSVSQPGGAAYFDSLRQNFDCVKNGSVAISGAYLDKCANDPELAKLLEENLAAYDGCVWQGYQNAMNAAQAAGGKLLSYSETWSIDGEGNLTMVSCGTVEYETGTKTWEEIRKDTLERMKKAREEKEAQKSPAGGEEDPDEASESQGGKVGINAGKLARMLAAAKTRSQVQAVVAKIQADLNQCDAGKEQGMDVDEASVQTAEQLLQQAKSRMGSAENREATPEEELASALAGLM